MTMDVDEADATRRDERRTFLQIWVAAILLRSVLAAVDAWVVGVPGVIEWPIDFVWAVALVTWLTAEWRWRRARRTTRRAPAGQVG